MKGSPMARMVSPMLLLVLLVAAMMVTAGCTSTQPISQASSTAVMITPSSVPHPDIFAEPGQAVIDANGNLSSDAERVLTVLALQISLEKFKQANGTYPDQLAELFPSFAPLDEHGSAMNSLPQTGDYKYSLQSGGYELSVATSKGEYMVTDREGGS